MGRPRGYASKIGQVALTQCARADIYPPLFFHQIRQNPKEPLEHGDFPRPVRGVAVCGSCELG
jgi:hypothetical protein